MYCNAIQLHVMEKHTYSNSYVVNLSKLTYARRIQKKKHTHTHTRQVRKLMLN